MDTSLEKPKEPIALPLTLVVQFIVYAIIATAAFYAIKLSLSERVGATEGDIKVLQSQYTNLANGLDDIKDAQVRQEEFLRTLLKDRGYVPETILSKLKTP